MRILTVALLIMLLTLFTFNVYDARGQECFNLPPVAQFSYSPAQPKVCNAVLFDASASYDPDGFIRYYSWDFGDGNITLLETFSVIHHYTRPGEFSVNLTVFDNLYVSNSTVEPISVGARIIASFSYLPLDPQVGTPVTFNASDSMSEAGSIVSYVWNFGDGNITEVDEALVVHHFLAEGVYTVELNVTGSLGLWDATSRTVNVTKPLVTPPTAVFTWTPTVGEAGEPVSFDASASSPNGGEIVLYLWDFGDGGFGNSSTPFIMHTYESFGNYTVVLNITDSEGQTASTANVVTVIEKPVADFFFLPENIRVCANVTFNGSISDPRGGDIVEYAWSFGDNSSVLYGMTVVHRFKIMREYNVSLNVTDSEGKWDVKTVTLKILPHIADLNEDGVVDIIDLSIFGIAFGSIPGDEKWDARVDIVSDEIINILDGVIIAVSFDPCAFYIVDP